MFAKKSRYLQVSLIILLVSLSLLPAKRVFGNRSNLALLGKTVKGKELLAISETGQIEQIIQPENQTEKPLYTLESGSLITYNPVVLSINTDYWEELDLFNSSEEFYFEVSANESILVNTSSEYSLYQIYKYYSFSWNISEYQTNSKVNLTFTLFCESDYNINHSTSILITIGEIYPTPELIDLSNFRIHLFHFPGSYLSAGPYYYYAPSGVNPYYHFTIYQDGYVEFKFGERELYVNKDLSAAEAKELMRELEQLGFYQMKEFYFAPTFDYYWHSYYQIYVESLSVQEWRGAEEFMEYKINPTVFANCMQAIKDRVDNLYFEPIRWKWDLVWIIGGSIFGGAGVLGTLIYVIFVPRKRR